MKNHSSESPGNTATLTCGYFPGAYHMVWLFRMLQYVASPALARSRLASGAASEETN